MDTGRPRLYKESRSPYYECVNSRLDSGFLLKKFASLAWSLVCEMSMVLLCEKRESGTATGKPDRIVYGNILFTLVHVYYFLVITDYR